MVLLYLKSPEFEFGNIATIITETLTTAGITITNIKHWTSPYHYGYTENPFNQLVDETFQDTRSKL